MATKSETAMNSLVNGLVQYVDNKINTIPYVKTDIGVVQSVTLTSGKYLHTVRVRDFDYTDIKSLGNCQFDVDSVVYILVPNGQYSNMFILGHLDDTNANIKGGTIDIGNGNFTVDSTGSMTAKSGYIGNGSNGFTINFYSISNIKNEGTSSESKIVLDANNGLLLKGTIPQIKLVDSIDDNARGSIRLTKYEDTFSEAPINSFWTETSIDKETFEISRNYRDNNTHQSNVYANMYSRNNYGNLNLYGYNNNTMNIITSISLSADTDSNFNPHITIRKNNNYLYLYPTYISGTTSDNRIKMRIDTFCPYTSGATTLGDSTYKWGQIYSTNSTISTSDKNEKKNIESLKEKAKDFIMSLNPVSYKFKNGTSNRTHYGLIAQDVEESMNKLGMSDLDFAGFCKDSKVEEYQVEELINKEIKDEKTGETKTVETLATITKERPIEGEYNYGLRYEEFIAPLIKIVQLQQEEINELRNRIEKLEKGE